MPWTDRLGCVFLVTNLVCVRAQTRFVRYLQHLTEGGQFPCNPEKKRKKAAPVKAKPRRMSQTDMQIVNENVLSMEASGVVGKSNSQWISEPVSVVRKDGDISFLH